MLKNLCVYDRAEIKEFYDRIGKTVEFDNKTMFFAMYDDGIMVAVVKMYPLNDTRCMIEKAVCADSVTSLMEEFLVKSAINYALTFDSTELQCDNAYERYLLPMNFHYIDGELVGKTSEVDFPHACGGH